MPGDDCPVYKESSDSVAFCEATRLETKPNKHTVIHRHMHTDRHTRTHTHTGTHIQI